MLSDYGLEQHPIKKVNDCVVHNSVMSQEEEVNDCVVCSSVVAQGNLPELVDENVVVNEVSHPNEFAVIPQVGHSFELEEGDGEYAEYGEIMWKLIEVGEETCKAIPE